MRSRCLIVLAGALLASGPAFGQLDVSWNTLACGGRIEMTGGTMTLSGAIGQTDDDILAGGGLELRGGFWGGIPASDCAGDVNGDGATDLTDLAMVLAEFGCGAGCMADLTGDGSTDLTDLAIVLGDFGCS